MKHCVASCFDFEEIYSVRDNEDIHRCTVELEDDDSGELRISNIKKTRA